MTTVAYGTVWDTTTNATPVRVVATMAEPIVRLAGNPLCLDGPLSWCAVMAATEAGARVPPMGRWAPDLALPLATWTAPAPLPDPDPRLLAADGKHVWGWACSAAHYRTDLHGAVQIRKRPAQRELVRFTRDRTYNAGLGPHKARDVTIAAQWTPAVTWWALASDAERLTQLLTHLTHLGADTGQGHGRILSLAVHPDPTAQHRWRRRPMPDPAGRPGSLRAPYHHHSRRMPCSSTAPG